MSINSWQLHTDVEIPSDVGYVRERLGEWPTLTYSEKARMIRLLEEVARHDSQSSDSF